MSVADEPNLQAGVDAHGDLLTGQPVLSPLAWPLSYSLPVHKMSPDYLPAPTPEQPIYLLVYRHHDDNVKFMEINPVTARLLFILQNNSDISGEQALAQIAQEMNHPNPEVVMQGGLHTLQELHAYGIIPGTRR